MSESQQGFLYDALESAWKGCVKQEGNPGVINTMCRQVGPTLMSVIRLIAVLPAVLLVACASAPDTAAPGPSGEAMSFDQFAQTDFNRTVTMAMRDNMDSLYLLQDKLYRRNPAQWRNGGFADLDSAIQDGRIAIENGRSPADLAGLRDIEILSVALDPAYHGDRVAAFIYGLADMVLAAHNDKTRFYASDSLSATRIYHAARNVETAAWLLNSRRDTHDQPLLLANELSGDATNLSYERLFGELVGRLDLVANLLDENIRRVGIGYLQGLLLFNFLPVR